MACHNYYLVRWRKWDDALSNGVDTWDMPLDTRGEELRYRHVIDLTPPKITDTDGIALLATDQEVDHNFVLRSFGNGSIDSIAFSQADRDAWKAITGAEITSPGLLEAIRDTLTIASSNDGYTSAYGLDPAGRNLEIWIGESNEPIFYDRVDRQHPYFSKALQKVRMIAEQDWSEVEAGTATETQYRKRLGYYESKYQLTAPAKDYLQAAGAKAAMLLDSLPPETTLTELFPTTGSNINTGTYSYTRVRSGFWVLSSGSAYGNSPPSQLLNSTSLSGNDASVDANTAAWAANGWIRGLVRCGGTNGGADHSGYAGGPEYNGGTNYQRLESWLASRTILGSQTISGTPSGTYGCQIVGSLLKARDAGNVTSGITPVTDTSIPSGASVGFQIGGGSSAIRVGAITWADILGDASFKKRSGSSGLGSASSLFLGL